MSSAPIASLRVHHLGVAVSNMDAAIATYRDLLGLHVVSGPFDDPLQRVRVCFLRGEAPNDALVELISPIPGEPAEQSPVHLYLKKELGAYHICYETSEIESAITHLRSKGSLVVSGPTPAVAFERRRIAWLFLPTRQLIELVEVEHRV